MRNANEELELYREIYAMTGDIIYRYSIADDVMVMYKSNDVRSHFGTTINDYVRMLRNQNFSDDEKECMETYIHALSSGKVGFFEQDMKLKFDTAQGSWYKVLGKTIYDDNNNPTYVIGKLIPIEQSDEFDNNADNRKNTDELTGLLNSSEFKKQLAGKCIECDGNAGGFIILSVSDVDRITGVDMEALMDNVYINVAQGLKRLFYYDAIIGRIKPDEFAVVYYGGDVSTEFLSKVEELKEELKNPAVSSLRERAISICGGAYCGPFEKNGMHNILEKTSMAMSFARYRKDNAIQIYTKELAEMFHTYNSVTKRTLNAEMKIEHKLIKNMLEVLSDSEDVEQSVMEMFSIVGQEYGLDKIILYEFNIPKHQIKSDIFWDKQNGGAPKLKKTSIDFRAIDWFNSKTEMAVVNDASSIKEADPLSVIMTESLKSYVVAGFQVGDFAGCISFETHNNRRKWNKSELKVFELVRRLMSTCLINIKLYQQMLSDARNSNNLDVLTSMYKYNVFLEEAGKYVTMNKNEQLAIINIKLNGFYRVNECYGFETGDDIIRNYADVIKNDHYRFIMGTRLNADNLVILVRLFDDRGRMLSEATIDVLYGDFICACSNRYPAVELKVKSKVCKINSDGRDIADYVSYADKMNVR